MDKFLVKYLDKSAGGVTDMEVDAENAEAARITVRQTIGIGKPILDVIPIKVQKNKYKNKKVEYDGIKFDSKMERDFYIHLKKLQANGLVYEFFMQKNYVLIDAYTRSDGTKVRASYYKADFEVHYSDNRIEVIDIKGMLTDVFKLKQKIFETRYPFELKLITYSKKYGGWITLQDLEEKRKQNKLLNSKGIK